MTTIGYRQLAACALQVIKPDWSRAGAVVFLITIIRSAKRGNLTGSPVSTGCTQYVGYGCKRAIFKKITKHSDTKTTKYLNRELIPTLTPPLNSAPWFG